MFALNFSTVQAGLTGGVMEASFQRTVSSFCYLLVPLQEKGALIHEQPFRGYFSVKGGSLSSECFSASEKQRL